MGRNTNMGHLMMTGALNQEKHGYARRYKSSGTSRSHPNIQKIHAWQRKLLAVYRAIEKTRASSEAFEGRLLESLDMLDGKPRFGRNGALKKVKLKPAEEVVADAGKSVQRMLDALENAGNGIRLAKREAINEADKDEVKGAEADIGRLREKLLGLASRIEMLRQDYGLDSVL